MKRREDMIMEEIYEGKGRREGRWEVGKEREWQGVEKERTGVREAGMKRGGGKK